ncbi:ParB N-terminal domain-containing protein [Streptomyces sp. NPDC088739]|uniref:ParB N-terminal domain-containing protein n=1 Tax=Streptomyces sp. NPDC088739 TaxID=3365882 RepID=UPI0038102F04
MQIAPDLVPLLVPVASLTRWPGNAKLHDRGAIQASIEQYGYTDPVVVQTSTRRIIAGNGRHLVVAEDIGHDQIPAVFRDLTDAEALFFVLLHNRSQELGGGYEEEALAALVRDAKQLAGDADLARLTGWADHDLAALEQALNGADEDLADVIEDLGAPAADELWPVLEFKVPPPARAAFYRLTEGISADGTDTGRFIHLLKTAGWSPDEAL